MTKPVDIPKRQPATQLSFQEEYYKTKLDMLRNKSQKKEIQPQPQALPFQVAEQNLRSHMNKQVMASLYSQYFPSDKNPYMS